jgi:hypothetical protein
MLVPPSAESSSRSSLSTDKAATLGASGISDSGGPWDTGSSFCEFGNIVVFAVVSAISDTGGSWDSGSSFCGTGNHGGSATISNSGGLWDTGSFCCRIGTDGVFAELSMWWDNGPTFSDAG